MSVLSPRRQRKFGSWKRLGGWLFSLEDERAADAACGDGGELALGVRRDEHDVLRQACTGDEQGVKLPGLLELVEPPEGGDNALSWPAGLPAVLDDLEVGARLGGLDPEEHGVLVFETP